MNKQNISFTLGRRLKELREEHGLTHVELIKQLNEKYGISISRDSIMAYEIAEESRAKADKLPNMGMRVEYLYCLADFYGVSLDYLLGKAEIKSTDIKIQQFCNLTGLSELAGKRIWFLNACGFTRELKFVSKLLSSSSLIVALQYFSHGMDLQEKCLERDKSAESIEVALENAGILYEERRDLLREARAIYDEKIKDEFSAKVELTLDDTAKFYFLLADEAFKSAIEDAKM